MTNKNGWNYRVFHEIGEDDVAPFTIRDAYYDDDKVTTWASDAAFPIGDTAEELLRDALHMVEAFAEPVISLIDGKMIPSD